MVRVVAKTGVRDGVFPCFALDNIAGKTHVDVGRTEAGALLRDILQTHGKLTVSAASLRPEDDLFQLGLSSLATVNLMLAIEERFGIVIPDEALTRATFQSLAALTGLVDGLRGEGRA